MSGHIWRHDKTTIVDLFGFARARDLRFKCRLCGMTYSFVDTTRWHPHRDLDKFEGVLRQVGWGTCSKSGAETAR